MCKPKTKRRLIPASLTLTLLVALTSCVTRPPVVVKVDLPAITWPLFPDPAGLVTKQGDIVSMPLSYWLSMTRYVIDVEAGIAEVEAARELATPR